MKKTFYFILVLVLLISISTNVFALTNSVSNSNYTLTGASNLSNGSSTWTASSSSVGTNYIFWNSQTWNRAYFLTFENMTYHSSVDSGLGNLSVVSDVTW